MVTRTSSQGLAPQGSPILVTEEISGFSAEPAVCGLAGGGFVVIWNERDPDLRSNALFGQRFDASGAAVGDEFLITSNPWGNGSVVSQPDGGFVVAWAGSDQETYVEDIFGQRFGPDGTAQGEAFKISSSSNPQQISPTLVSLEEGGFTVAWMSGEFVFSEGEDNTYFDVHFRTFDTDGVAVGEMEKVASPDGALEMAPYLFRQADGTLALRYVNYPSDGGDSGYYGLLLDGSGTPIGTEFRVEPIVSATFSALWSEYSISLSGGETASSRHYSNLSWDGFEGFAVSLIDAETGFELEEVRIPESNMVVRDIAPSIAALADGGLFVTWMTENEEADNTDPYNKVVDIFAQMYDLNQVSTGDVTVSGSAVQGQTLTVSNTLADANGLGAITYRWQRDGENIKGATGETYTLTPRDSGAEIAVMASYTDGIGTVETVVSTATSPVKGNMVLTGDAGDNELTGGRFDDRLSGGAGDDTLIGRKGADKLNGGDGTDSASGGAGNDTLRGHGDGDHLTGNGGDDLLQGGRGHDSLLGGAGHDSIEGGSGRDRIEGQKGGDVLAGGTGRDNFVFNRGDGHDTITDFELGIDQIEIGRGASRLRQLDFEQQDDHVAISFRNVEITVENTTVDQLLGGDHFIFA
ncbi:calcium-binding protein [Leisingera methylohalidivorans]|uniref:calcium-binding protein n=1 Tax=Leisingera methylohalidivorans TaxID=133924 RepID=UPI0003FF40C4|nr:calcium-binding protein [Leisingera methylohalidivorans]